MSIIITILITVVAVAFFVRLSGNPRNHSDSYLRRRIFNWMPLGHTYALLYMGRYNLTIAKIAFGDVQLDHLPAVIASRNSHDQK